MIISIIHILDHSILLATAEFNFLMKIVSDNLEPKEAKFNDNFIDMIDSYNVDEALSTKQALISYLKTKKDKEITPVKQREYMLSSIMNDDYSNPEKCKLFIYEYNHIKIINSIVCDNEFLDFIDNKLFNIDLDPKILNNIIKILNLSIDLTINKDNYIDEPYNIIDIVGIDRINIYNIDKAKSILSKLNSKLKEKKIIYYPY